MSVRMTTDFSAMRNFVDQAKKEIEEKVEISLRIETPKKKTGGLMELRIFVSLCLMIFLRWLGVCPMENILFIRASLILEIK